MGAKNFDDLFDPFVISLSRTPERLEAFTKANSNAAISFKIFNAIEGEKIHEADIPRHFAPGAKFYTRSSLGNALSHLALWQRCVEQRKNFIVLEDDAVTRRDTKERLLGLLESLVDWDIVLLGYNTDVPLELIISPGIFCGTLFSAPYPDSAQLLQFVDASNPVGLHRLKLALGTCGYTISPKGAKVLAQACFPLTNPVVRFGSVNHFFKAAALDAVMATIYPKISAYACLAPLVMTPNNKANSTVKT